MYVLSRISKPTLIQAWVSICFVLLVWAYLYFPNASIYGAFRMRKAGTSPYLYFSSASLYEAFLFRKAGTNATNESCAANAHIWTNDAQDFSTRHMQNSAETFSNLSSDITIVTSFIELHGFIKGSAYRNTTVYYEWATAYSKVLNPIVLFTDSEQFVKHFMSIRRNLPTVIVHGDFKDCWSFTLLPAVTEIFSNATYPKHHPNTVVPMYSVVMAAKYDFVQWTTTINPFETSRVAWMDIGIYREYSMKEPCFTIDQPADFDKTRVAAVEVYPFKNDTRCDRIIWDNGVWLCGCIFYGYMQVVSRYVYQYRRATEAMLEKGLISTDQQTLYCMYSDTEIRASAAVDVQVQTFNNNGSFGDWFYLARYMRQVQQCYKSSK